MYRAAHARLCGVESSCHQMIGKWPRSDSPTGHAYAESMTPPATSRVIPASADCLRKLVTAAPARLWETRAGFAAFILGMYWLKSVGPVGARSLPTSVPLFAARGVRATRSGAWPQA